MQSETRHSRRHPRPTATRKYTNPALMGFALSAIGCFLLMCLIQAMSNPFEATPALVMGGSTMMASMMAIGNIEDVPDIQVSGNAIRYRFYLIETTQIDDSVAFPVPNASREVATIPLKAGQYPTAFEAHDIPTLVSTGEKGDLTFDNTNTFVAIMGGIRDQLLNFIEQKAGCRFIIIFEECESANRYIIGNPCRPMILKSFEKKNDKDSRSVQFTWENKSFRQEYKYVGAIPSTPPATHTQGATALAVPAATNEITIPEGTAATYAIATATGLAEADKGRVITLIGSGSGAKCATVADNTVFVLVDGATWTARSGSRLTLRVLDAQTLVELSRVQTA